MTSEDKVKLLQIKKIKFSYDRDFIEAIKIGDLHKVEYTIKMGANPYFDNGFAIRLAASLGHLHLVKHFINKYKMAVEFSFTKGKQSNLHLLELISPNVMEYFVDNSYLFLKDLNNRKKLLIIYKMAKVNRLLE